MRRFAGAWGWWSGEKAAAQCSALVERGEAAARVCGAARGWIGCRAAAVGGQLKAGGDPGETRPRGKLAGDLGGLGAVVALRRRRSWQVGPAGQRKQRRGRG